jgi:hypothetical protein
MGRAAPIHKATKLSDSGLSQGQGWDDEVTFNTQVCIDDILMVPNIH